MEQYFEKITENLFAFVIWDESWNSYNNCYVLIEGNHVTLIDTGKEEHVDHLENALKTIGLDLSSISTFVATHGHRDHIGGMKWLDGVDGCIHPKDIEIVPNELKDKLKLSLPDNGDIVNKLDCIHLGHHTKGSVALYHQGSKALFFGDHISFFGESFSGKSIVDEGNFYRDKFKRFVSDWSQNDEMREKYNFDLFRKGLEELTKFDVDYLCTGHGFILKGNINRFIEELLEYK